MALSFRVEDFMTTHWQNAIKKVWGVDVTLSKLSGEYDLNFLARGEVNYIVKVMRPKCPSSFVNMQCSALTHIRKSAPNTPVPQIIKTRAGKDYSIIADKDGCDRVVWVLEKLAGKVYADFARKSDELNYQIGQAAGLMDKALETFEHSDLERQFKWDLCEALWIVADINIVKDPARKEILNTIIADYKAIKPALDQLSKQAIHNDINDYNILVDGGLYSPEKLTGIIDLGDMCVGPRICDLAIAGAYIVLGHDRPVKALKALITGYHEENPLTTHEIDLLWPLLRMRLAVSVVNSTLMAKDNPNDPYVVISQKPAWDFLEEKNMQVAFPRALINAHLRSACTLPVTDTARDTVNWIEQQCGTFSPNFRPRFNGCAYAKFIC